MKSILLLVCIVVLCSSVSYAQDENHPPFIFTAYAGLFFPSNFQYRNTFQSSSEKIWGVGGSVPVEQSTFLAGDIAFFKAEAFLDPTRDSVIALEERFIHIGLLNKQLLSRAWYLRFSGGVSYTTVSQHITSPLVPEQSIDADKKVGYYGGVGLERFFGEGHFSIYGDIVYDYRRVLQKDLEGDFGGMRIVAGINMLMF